MSFKTFLSTVTTSDERLTRNQEYKGCFVFKPTLKGAALRVLVKDNKKEWMTFNPNVFEIGAAQVPARDYPQAEFSAEAMELMKQDVSLDVAYLRGVRSGWNKALEAEPLPSGLSERQEARRYREIHPIVDKWNGWANFKCRMRKAAGLE